MSKNFEFVVEENPSIDRSVSISTGGRAAKKLALTYLRVGMDVAADILEDYQHRTAFYFDEDTGEALSLTEAAKDFLQIGDTDGRSVPVPIMHDGVGTRTAKERLAAQRDFLREIISGSYDVPGQEDLEPLLMEWNLSSGGEVMDFRDPGVFDQVFSTNEFFFPVLTDVIEMLNELISGQDKVKNSKPLAASSRAGRRGTLSA